MIGRGGLWKERSRRLGEGKNSSISMLLEPVSGGSVITEGMPRRDHDHDHRDEHGLGAGLALSRAIWPIP